jgi:diguanylate cyclase
MSKTKDFAMMFVIAGVAGVVAVGLAALYFSSVPKTRTKPTTQDAAPPQKKTSVAESNGVESHGANEAFTKKKLVIHSLLHELTENVSTLLDESAQYDDAMRTHRISVEKAQSLASFEEVEQSLLEEVDKMMVANQRYAQQLEEANATVEGQRKELDKLQSNIEVDFLTNIPNRRGFDRRIVEALELAKRNGTHSCLVVIDVDYFKRVNDKFGHLAGDRILRAVAEVLTEEKRGSDFLARYGGEEFVLLLPETQLERAKILAERAREKVESSRFRLDNLSLAITVSMGVGQIDPLHDTPESYFDRVDAALYKAKQSGRNRVELA